MKRGVGSVELPGFSCFPVRPLLLHTFFSCHNALRSNQKNIFQPLLVTQKRERRERVKQKKTSFTSPPRHPLTLRHAFHTLPTRATLSHALSLTLRRVFHMSTAPPFFSRSAAALTILMTHVANTIDTK